MTNNSLPSKTTSLMTGMLSAVTPEKSKKNDGGLKENSRKSKNTYLKYSFNEEHKKESTAKKIDFLKDDVQEMTYGRRIALKLMKYKWYNPLCEESEEEKEEETIEDKDSVPRIVDDFYEDFNFEKPNLAKGWAFFEHQALYRYILPEGHETKPKKGIFTRCFRTLFMHANKKFERAEPGEDDDPTRLYSVLTPHKQLGDFGLGIGLYFSNLRILILVCFVCGCISMGNILYFASQEYDSESEGILNMKDMFLKGSAACSSQEWVPCPDCNCFDEGEDIFALDLLLDERCAVANATDTNGTQLIFGLKNNCDGTKLSLAATNFATVVVMVICAMLMGWYLRREEERFDEDEQTAQDYSVQIRDPPNDAKDPEEWRRFFVENFGAQVAACTCAVDNDLLIQALVERRERLRLINRLQPGKSMEKLDIAKAAAQIERDRNLFGRIKSSVVPGIPEHFSRLVALRGKVEGLAQLEYPVTNVFVTFETEDDQRKVLKTLSVGYSKSKNDVSSALPHPKYLFRQKHVLDVCEPEEPSAIRWEDLNASYGKRLKKRIYTTIFTLLALLAVFFIIWEVNRQSVVWATYTITFFNILFPLFAKFLTNYLESHASESSKQESLYFKIVLFRWVTTAVIMFVLVPFTRTLDYGPEGILTRVYLQFTADILLTRGLELLDIPGLLQRHILAPRAKTQDEMNLLFQGTPYELAERYTDMTKILFLCLYYCSIFPTSFFLCTISLSLLYLVDRVSLTRTWKRAPSLGPTISKTSRRYFYSMAVGVMAIFSSFFWSGFPFDNLCQNTDTPIDPLYVGNFTVSRYPGYDGPFDTGIENVTVTSDDFDYRFCYMSYIRQRMFPFVAMPTNNRIDPDSYMTDDQIISTTYFGWSAFGLMILILLKYFVIWYTDFKKRYLGVYESVGDAQGIPFSEVPSRSTYIPQVASNQFPFPLIACKVDSVDEEVFDFRDPDRSYKYYDLTTDAKRLLAAIKIIDPPCFTIVKTWAPERND